MKQTRHRLTLPSSLVMASLMTIWLITAALLMASPASAGERIASFAGTDGELTEEFQIQGPWLLHWSLASDFPRDVGLDIALMDAITGLHQGEVLERNSIGSGLILMRESGRFQLRVDANFARWRLWIDEISEQEASDLEPARRHAKPGWIRRR